MIYSSSHTDFSISDDLLSLSFDYGANQPPRRQVMEYHRTEVASTTYDPVLGRMLQVDNYVQNPFSSQSYNRYSYVLNNPLKYVDPDGENPLIVIAIMALAGSYAGGAIAAGSGGLEGANWNPGRWNGTDWWKGALLGGGLGALAGFAITTLGPLATNALYSGGMKGGGGLVASGLGHGLVGAAAGGIAGFGTGYGTDRIVHNRTHREAINTGFGLAKYGAALGAAVGAAYGLSVSGFERVESFCKYDMCGDKHFTKFPSRYPIKSSSKLIKPVTGQKTKWVDRTYWSTLTSEGTSINGVLQYVMPTAPSWLGSPNFRGPWFWQSDRVLNWHLDFFMPDGSNPASVGVFGAFQIAWDGIYINNNGIDFSIIYEQQISYPRDGWSFFGLFTIWKP